MDTPQKKPMTLKSFLREMLEIVLIIVLVVLPFRIFVAEPYIVSGASMSNTFETGHYLIINKFWHKFDGLERGDVIVFRSPTSPSESYIKRVVALPGETIRISNNTVSVRGANEEVFSPLEEPYTSSRTYANLEQTLTEEEYFVLGDNRSNSSDSRSWGPLNKSLIKGEPVLRLYPFSQVTPMPGTEVFDY